jgi:uncharacterized membrane protein YkoI
MILVIDERPDEVHFDLSERDQNQDVTLLTIIEPAVDFDLSLPPALPEGITVDRALTIAHGTNLGIMVTEIRLKRERGVLVYRVDFSDRMRVLIDARSGQILELNPRGGDNNINLREDDDEPRPMLIQGIATDFEMIDAIGLALERYPGTVFERAKLDHRDGRLVYWIKLDNGLEVVIDANSGHYLNDNDPPNYEVRIRSSEAIETALGLFPNATVNIWELTVENGRMMYDITLDNGTVVYVDAFTGLIIESK